MREIDDIEYKWVNVYNHRIYLSSYGGLVITLKSCELDEYKSVEFPEPCYIVPLKESLKYTINYSQNRGFYLSISVWELLIRVFNVEKAIGVLPYNDMFTCTCGSFLLRNIKQGVTTDSLFRFDITDWLRESGITPKEFKSFINEFNGCVLEYTPNNKGFSSLKMFDDPDMEPLQTDGELRKYFNENFTFEDTRGKKSGRGCTVLNLETLEIEDMSSKRLNSVLTSEGYSIAKFYRNSACGKYVLIEQFGS